MTQEEKFRGNDKLEALFFEWVEVAEITMESKTRILQAEESLSRVRKAAEIDPKKWAKEIPESEAILALMNRKYDVMYETMEGSWKNYTYERSRMDLGFFMENTIPIATL